MMVVKVLSSIWALQLVCAALILVWHGLSQLKRMAGERLTARKAVEVAEELI
jgi:hypothetical protein